MLLRQRRIINVAATVILLIWVHITSVTEARPKNEYKCPIGFSLSFTKEKEDPICHRLKEPEEFADKFVDCSGNLYTSKLYRELGMNNTNSKLWAEFKSLYPGGPFIDWSYKDSTGDILIRSYDVEYSDDQGLDEEFCTVIKPDGNLTAVGCDEKHYRYCFVKPYEELDDMKREGCESIQGWRFWSPKPTCLTSITGVGGGNVRATWRQAEDLCIKHGGTLLQRGWRYANNPLLHDTTNIQRAVPLGILMTSTESLIWLDKEDGNNLVPDSEWSFENEQFSANTSLVSLKNNSWHLVDDTFIFYDVICEKSIHLNSVSLQITFGQDGQLGLSVNDTSVDESKIWCFSDSVIFYPSRVKVTRIDDSANFVLKPLSDGYYWCIHVDSNNYKTSESNRELFIREKTSILFLYAIKIRVKKEYTFENLDKLLRVWSKKLSDYIALRNLYVKAYGADDLMNGNSEGILHRFKERRGYLSNESAMQFLKLKRLFLDGKTALLHAQVTPDMEAVAPGYWEGLQILYMKPAYYCKGFENIPTLPLGKSITRNCKVHTCVGNFNEGVQWVSTKLEDCATKPPTSVQSTLDIQSEASPREMKTSSINRTYIHQDSSSEEHHHTTPELYITNTTPCDDATNNPTTAEVSTVNTPSEVTTSSIWSEVTTVNTPSEVTTLEYPFTHPTLPPPPPTPTTSTTTTTTTGRPLRPEEHLQNVMDNMAQLLQDETNPVLVETIGQTFNQVDELLEGDDDLEIPGEFLHLIDQLSFRADLNGSQSHSTVRNNIALLMADARPGAPVRGLQILSRDNATFTQEAFQFLTVDLNETHLDAELNEAVVYLPESIAESERRISFVVFRNDRAFHGNYTSSFSVNSRVLSVNVENVTQFQDGEVINLHFRPEESSQRNNSRACAYWRFLEDGTGTWEQDGCVFISASQPGTLDTCQCTHLTHFAEVLIPANVFSETNEKMLEIFSVVGCVLSIIGILMVALTAVMFRSWRRDFSNKIWLQLCLAILLLTTCFLIVVFSNFKEYNIPCMLVGLLLHYSVVASFCWMLVAAILSYRRLVLVFTRDASHKLLRASAFSWGAPCAVVGVLLSVSPHAYAGRFDEKTPSGSFCYPTGLSLWLAVYAPIALMLLANWTLFALIVRSVFASRRIQRHGDKNEAIRCATVSCLLVFLFGLPWIFGFFASNIVGAYLFTLTATFQGFVLFVFFVVGNKKTRDLWLNKLKIKQTRKVPVTSSTYGKSSGGVNWRAGSVRGVPSVEATMSKPRSLASSDDSRFS